MQNKRKNQEGQVILVGIVFFAILLSLSAALLGYVTIYVKSERQTTARAQALQLAESGIDLAVSKLNQDSGYTGESNTALGNGTFSIAVSTVNQTTKNITSTGSVTTGPVTATRTVKATVTIGNSVIAFNYGVQAGNGGFSITGGSTINGNVYSNGNISATTGVHITGSATAANQPALDADQANETPVPISSCTSSTCVTFANSSSTQDFAQSFQISGAIPINNIQFYIKKVGSPSDITLRIVNDNSGSPGTTVYLTRTISASSVTSNFGWVTAAMPTTPVLNDGMTYWMVLDAGSSSSKYYIIGANIGGYPTGAAKIGQYGSTWSNTSPSGLDGYFRIYLGGGTSMIGGNTYATGVYVGTTASDNAWAHTVQGATVTGKIYCQTSSYTNKACDTSRADPNPVAMPLTDQNIQDWKDEAIAGGTITGDYNVGYAGATIGPKEITGNLTIGGGGTLNMTGTLYIHGTITVSGGGSIRLDPSYGASNGVLVNDGYVVINGGGNFYGSGQAGSYVFLITTSTCPVTAGCNGNNAITLSGGAGTIALIAQDGTVHVSGGSALKALTARQIIMDGGGTLIYDSGLVNANFTSGPGGSWAFVKGSYSIDQ